MSKIVDALKRAESAKRTGGVVAGSDAWNRNREFRVVTVASNKGGVGKTTIASNLAVYLRALREDEPVLIFGFDDQTTLDRMFALDASPGAGDIADGLREESLARVARFGQYGVDYVPASQDLASLRELVGGPDFLRQILLSSKRGGTVVIDTKSDFERPTCAAVVAADLTIVVVKDNASLVEAKRTFDLLEKAGRPRESARILLSLVDMRVKYHEDEAEDVLAHLLSQIRRDEYPVFQTFLSRSPKVESLYTNPKGRALAILQGAKQSTVHRQMIQLTHEVVRDLDLVRDAMAKARVSDGQAAPAQTATDSRAREIDTPTAATHTDSAVPPISPPVRPPVSPPSGPPASAPQSRRKGPRFWGDMMPNRES